MPMDITRWNAANVNQLFERINRNSIGMDEYFDRLFTLHETTSNYPPYNLVTVSNVESRLELALAGYSKEDIKVETESNKLFVQCTKPGDSEPDHEYLQRGIARRAFTWSRTIADDVEVQSVDLTNGLLTIRLRRIIPDHQKKKTYELTGN